MVQLAIKIVLSILVIIIFFLLILKIWTNEIDIVRWLRKPSDIIPVKQKTNPPNIVPSMVMLNTKYRPGVEVEGVIWQKDFETHILKIVNNSEHTECHDLRVYIELPGAIISYDVLESSGSQDLTFSQPKLPAGIGEKTPTY